MKKDRDLCWLKKAAGKGLGSFCVVGSGELGQIGETIKREMPLLFEGMREVEEKDANVLFRRVQEEGLSKEGYRIVKTGDGYGVEACGEQGLLYGMFGLHRFLITGMGAFPYVSIPDQSIRMINHWDNFDGSIERGYAGDSIFYDKNRFRGDMDLVRQYARLLCSVGINGISINNVNVHQLETHFIEPEYLTEIKKISDVFGEYGIKTFLSVNYASPMSIGGLQTADPLEETVRQWWKDTVAGIYQVIPDFAGFVVKADSEGRPGPFTYGRNHDEGANMLAEAVAPYGGIIIWRCFVYNCRQDWRDRSLDRAKAAYDIFMELDGKFADNVILQIKNGPIDFQIREPHSPLFGALKATNQMLEFQITQEYTGHQIDICYLVPMWKETMDFDTKYEGDSVIKHVIKNQSHDRAMSGIAAVGSVGMDANWTGNKLSQANLYGYGRMVWSNDAQAEEIAREWIRLSFDLNPDGEEKLLGVLMTSRETYENYTCPLSVGFMCKPKLHYGPDIDGYEYDSWGTYHYADRNGLGRDRTKVTGTAYTFQYSDERAREYEDLSSCPDEYLLFFHHVPYTHVLHSGKTVIQHIYDTHFEGVEKVEAYQRIWEGLKGQLDEESYENGKERLERQLKNAINWRDQINSYFYRKSGIPDKKGRTIYE